MKKITFTKACKATNRVISRPDFPGYLLIVDHLPGVEFVLARSSSARGDGWVFTRGWHLYDRATGLTVSLYTTKGKTREQCHAHAHALGYLSGVTPESYAKYIDDRMVVRMTQLIQGEGQ